MPSLTNITFPPEDEQDLRDAIAHYRYENFNQFFRICGHALIAHYKGDDRLLSPLHFETISRDLNYFGEILAIMNDEELIRFRRRFEMRRKERMAEIISDELEEREGIAAMFMSKKRSGHARQINRRILTAPP